MRLPHGFVAASMVLLASGCASPLEVTTVSGAGCDPTGHSLLVVGGGSTPEVVPLSAGQRGAIAALIVDTDPAGLCSAVVVEPGLALTAAHCTPAGVELVVAFGESALSPAATSAVEAVHRHERLDVALIEHTTPESVQCIPIEGISILDAEVSMGQDAEIAGFGFTSPTGTSLGDLQFAATSIVDIEPDHFVVADALDHSAACLGDSGGPLLVETEAGVRVAGVLDNGDAGCDGRDYFTRGDIIRDWAMGGR